MKKIILDCDPGHDDAIALLLAWGNPQIDLLAVTTVALVSVLVTRRSSQGSKPRPFLMITLALSSALASSGVGS